MALPRDDNNTVIQVFKPKPALIPTTLGDDHSNSKFEGCAVWMCDTDVNLQDVNAVDFTVPAGIPQAFVKGFTFQGAYNLQVM